MISKVEAFHRPSDVEEACRLLRQRRGAATPLAGGTDLLVRPQGSWSEVVSLQDLGLQSIERRGGGLVLGAGLTLQAVADARELQGLADGLLCQAARAVASRNVRNVATLAGNVAAALPSADLPPALIALGAVAVVAGPGKKRRTLPVEDLVTGYRTTALRPGELIIEFKVPLTRGLRGHFRKLGRTASDIALVNVAAAGEIRRGRWVSVRLCLGAVAPTPRLVPSVATALVGQPVSEESIREAARLVHASIAPVDDHRCSADYRGRVAEVLARRALLALAGLDEGSAR